jgi:hypothetical protein
MHYDTRYNVAQYRALFYWVSFMQSVIMQVSFMQSVMYAECHSCRVSSFMQSVIYAECRLCRVSYMQSVIYAECHLCRVSFLQSFILAEFHSCRVSFLQSFIILNAVNMSVFMLSVEHLNIRLRLRILAKDQRSSLFFQSSNKRKLNFFW